jgi:hypothetical protein
MSKASKALRREIHRQRERTAHEVTSPEDLCREILQFLVGEFARKESRRCRSVDLFYAPGGGYRDELIRTWTREDDFKSSKNLDVERLASTILEIAEGEVSAKPTGRHRFVVLTRQSMGGRQMMSFAISPMYFGDENGSDDGKKTVEDKVSSSLDQRKQLLAHVAARVASAVVTESGKKESLKAIAEMSINLAEMILQRVGL